MADTRINIEGSFELPSEADWHHLGNKDINGMRIDIGKFDAYKDAIFAYPRIQECILGLNNKIGSLCITYALCRHYYDLGIPDEPWFRSPSSDGKFSVQYMPNFRTEHYMRRFWFNHFASNLYVTVFGVWDSIIELLDIFYDLNIKPDMRQRSRVMETLKSVRPEVVSLLDNLKNNPIYKQANEYRTQFVHGIAPSDISARYDYKKDVETQVIDSEASIAAGRAVYKPVSHAVVMSDGVGHYTPVKKVIETFDQFAALSSSVTDKLIDLMVTEAK